MKNTSRAKTMLLSLLVMALWGSLFPMIKIGYSAFSIDASDIPSILMFAGTRFTVCGALICAIALFRKEKLSSPKLGSIGAILLIGVFSIILHYAFTYIGLSLTDSSKTALLKQLGALIYVCFAFLFIKGEVFNPLKIVGALIGFLGIIAINLNAGGISFSLGDALIIGASVCTVVANVLSKSTLKSNSPIAVTGISQLAGGVVLSLAAWLMGADTLSFSPKSFAVFAYICTASMIAYILWNHLLCQSDLSNMFIIKFAEPLFACLFGAILLNEDIFKWQYPVAFILISFGIVLGNRNQKQNAREEKHPKKPKKEGMTT